MMYRCIYLCVYLAFTPILIGDIICHIRSIYTGFHPGISQGRYPQKKCRVVKVHDDARRGRFGGVELSDEEFQKKAAGWMKTTLPTV